MQTGVGGWGRVLNLISEGISVIAGQRLEKNVT
jgi:hypothetical protein